MQCYAPTNDTDEQNPQLQYVIETKSKKDIHCIFYCTLNAKIGNDNTMLELIVRKDFGEMNENSEML